MWLRLPFAEPECYARNGVPEQLYGVKVARKSCARDLLRVHNVREVGFRFARYLFVRADVAH
jgi:hypothetical protein